MYYDMEATNLSLNNILKISELDGLLCGSRTNLNSDFSIHAAWTCFQTLKGLLTSVQIKSEIQLTVYSQPFVHFQLLIDSPQGISK